MKRNHTGLAILCSSTAAFLVGCGSNNYEPSELHITKEKVDADAPKFAADVPRLVRRTAKLPTLEYAETQETFDVVVHNVSVRDLLFTLARDLKLDVDIDARVGGVVSISAFDQTFENVLERIKEQLPIRYDYVGDAIVVKNDEPYLKQYHVEYLNVERNYTSSASITGITTDGQSGGSGTASVTNTSEYSFWAQVETVLEELVTGTYVPNEAGVDLVDEDQEIAVLQSENEPEISEDFDPYFVIDEATGVVLVYAPEFVQTEVEAYLDSIQEISRRQVLLEATVVEVALNNAYSQGIDWSVFDSGATEGLFASQGANLGPTLPSGGFQSGFPGSVLQNNVRAYQSENLFFGSALRIGDLEAAVSLLQEFGSAKVVSSPRVSAMNNQGALMRVVDNNVYFEVETEREAGDADNPPIISATVTETIVPEGFVMNVLPQISAVGQIMLNLKPSLTRITGERSFPAVEGSPVAGTAPITSVREFESFISLNDGEVGVLGGVIEDNSRDTRTGLPGAMDLPGVGSLFEHNNELTRRTQLVIFIKATVITNPSVNGDYVDYRDLLPDTDFMRRGKGNVLFTPDQKEVN